jgi:serine/threonine protein kinase/Tol biopolymer transport system component
MPVTTGSRLGPYEITSRLGAGGMGEVWRAKDTRLDRSVAIKILPAELAHNAQLRVRLEREAKAISQLNHPNICTLYDVGDDYLVMELLDGDTLAERVARGPLPLTDVLKFGVQIAEALDRAHRAGIVHRDLKPSNVMLTKSGAKLLDFGLARSEINAPAVDTEGPTMQVRESLTEEGTIVGTFQYMAPEQLEAQPADARTDIFALGCVLYEMATGRRAFRGRTKTSLIAAIVSSEPQPISSLQPVTPTAFEHVVQKCLEKEPDGRWQSAHDVAEELKWIAKELERGEIKTRGKSRVHWAIAALLAVTTLAGIGMWLRERAKPAEPIAFSITPPRDSNATAFSLAADGRSVALVLDVLGRPTNDIVVRRIDDLTFRKIGTTEGGVGTMAWSPDGEWLAYIDRGKLLRIPSAGGNPETVARNVAYGAGLAWNRDDTILFAPRFGGALFRVPATGGEPVAVTTLDPKRNESLHGWPRFLPDGKHFLFIVHTTGEQQNEIHVGTLDGKHQLLMRADSVVGFARGCLVFVRDGAMYAQTFDTGKLALEGKPRRLVEGVAFSESNALAYAMVAGDGAIAYAPAVSIRVAYDWHDRNGRKIASAFEEPNTNAMTFSEDGTKVALVKEDLAKGASDIYSLDLARNVRTRITGGTADYNNPVWAPSGDRVYFSGDRNGLYDIYSQVDDGTAPAQVIWQSGEDKYATDVTPDGQSLIVNVYSKAESKGDIWLVPTNPSAGQPRLLIGSEASESGGVVSRDGKWLAYVSDRSGRNEVYVRRFPNGRSVQVSTDGAAAPQWSHDGSEITFWSLNRKMCAARVTANGETPVPGTPQVLFSFEAPLAGSLPSRIDDRFLMATIPDAADQSTVLNYVRRAW